MLAAWLNSSKLNPPVAQPPVEVVSEDNTAPKPITPPKSPLKVSASTSIDETIENVTTDLNPTTSNLYTLPHPQHAVYSLALRDINTLFAAGGDGRITVYRKRAGVYEQTESESRHRKWISSIQCAEDSNAVISTSEDGEMHIYRLRDEKDEPGAELTLIDNVNTIHNAGIYDSMLKHNMIVTGSKDQSIALSILQPAGVRYIASYKEHSSVVRSVDLQEDGRHAVSGSQDKTVCFYDLRTADSVQQHRFHHRVVCDVGFLNHGRSVWSSGYDGKIHITDVRNFKQPLFSLSEHRSGTSISDYIHPSPLADGRRLVCVCSDTDSGFVYCSVTGTSEARVPLPCNLKSFLCAGEHDEIFIASGKSGILVYDATVS